MKSYKVVVTREGDNWLADVPQVEGTHTFARTLLKLDLEVREALALALDLPEGAEAALELDYEVHTGDAEQDQEFARIREGRTKVLAAKQALDVRTGQVARKASADLSTRDLGWLLGLSPQRVSQLTHSQ